MKKGNKIPIEPGVICRSKELFGSMVWIKLPKEHKSMFKPAFSELERIEHEFSRFISNSQLFYLNQNLGKWQSASDELLSLVLRAEEFYKLTYGRFDITVKEYLDELGYDENYSFRPKSKQSLLQSAFRHIFRQPFSRPIVDLQKGKIFLRKPIDFGGLGKGYAIDRIAWLFEKSKISHYCINAGGDIYAKRDSSFHPWIILLEHPDDEESAIGQLELDGLAIAGSAPNRRKWGENGTLHHLIDARTGKPAIGVKAVFVLAKTAIEADAYSTAIFTCGFEGGIALSRRLPIELISISAENKLYISPGFPAKLFG